MENIIYKIELTENKKIDIFISTICCESKTTKELGVCVYDNNGFQLDADLNEKEIDSLIKYLQECKEYIKEYNSLVL